MSIKDGNHFVHTTLALGKGAYIAPGLAALNGSGRGSIVGFCPFFQQCINLRPGDSGATQHRLLHLYAIALQVLGNHLLGHLALLQIQPVGEAGPLQLVRLDHALVHQALDLGGPGIRWSRLGGHVVNTLGQGAVETQGAHAPASLNALQILRRCCGDGAKYGVLIS